MSELRDYQILMHLDGVAEPQVIMRINASEVLQARAQALKDFQSRLSASLFRAICPDSILLHEYYLEQIPSQDTKLIAEHISECPHCDQELLMIKQFFMPNLVERIVARLISGGRSILKGLTPEFGLRGAEPEPYIFEAGNTRISLDIQEDFDNPGRKVLIGLITGAEIQNYAISLWRKGAQINQASADEWGNFTLHNLEDGEYELWIRGPKIEIQVQTFMI